MAAQAEVKSMGAEACGSVVPLLASRSASVLPSRPTCPRIHWTLTRFDEPIFARTVQMELHVVSVCLSSWTLGKAFSPYMQFTVPPQQPSSASSSSEDNVVLMAPGRDDGAGLYSEVLK